MQHCYAVAFTSCVDSIRQELFPPSQMLHTESIQLFAPVLVFNERVSNFELGKGNTSQE